MSTTAPERFVPLVVRRRLALAPLLEPEVHTTWAAVLFVDLSGFTRLTETLAGEEGGAEEEGAAAAAAEHVPYQTAIELKHAIGFVAVHAVNMHTAAAIV